MTPSRRAWAVHSIRSAAVPLTGAPDDFDPLLARIDGASYVLLGEASHGTHEFYRIRAEITKRLIIEKGFAAVAIEGDWPDAWRVDRFVRGNGSDADATDALGGFRRFPQWMWRNADVLDFVGWLRAHNDLLPPGAPRVGFFGLDLYSMHASMDAVLRYLRTADPAAARRARERYACFDHFGPDPQDYGRATTRGLAPSCEHEVVAQLAELRSAAVPVGAAHAHVTRDDLFFATQNARVVQNAERYYRAMFFSNEASWNPRDRHMAETLDELAAHLRRSGRSPRVVVWAHNSHLGDARATEMGDRGELNVGQLVRQRYGVNAVLVGFTTYAGTVTAATNWNEPADRKIVRDAMPSSVEALFHEAGPGNFFLDVGWRPDVTDALDVPRLERAIGVIYRPGTERQSHYFYSRVSRQFDVVLHYDQTRAVEPLERTAEWERGELPETYPSAL